MIKIKLLSNANVYSVLNSIVATRNKLTKKIAVVILYRKQKIAVVILYREKLL